MDARNDVGSGAPGGSNDLNLDDARWEIAQIIDAVRGLTLVWQYSSQLPPEARAIVEDASLRLARAEEIYAEHVGVEPFSGDYGSLDEDWDSNAAEIRSLHRRSL